MSHSDVKTRLRLFLIEKFPNEGVELADDTNLLEEWFIDSLGIVETVLFIETEFGVELARADINGANFRDLVSLSGLVAGRLDA